MHTLTEYGWTQVNQREWNDLKLAHLQPARVIADFGTSLKLTTPQIISAELSGKLAHYTSSEATPKVGDWVAMHVTDNGSATVESVVLRQNEIARKVAGKQVKKQIIAANVDIAFVLLALDNDFSIERLRRFLYQLSISSIEAVIVLNKSDKTDNVQSYIEQLNLLEQPIIVTTATSGTGVAEIAARIAPGHTAILLGSSGVGKSTLTNRLLGREAQATNNVKVSDGTGKHTTVHRELFILPGGGILIDTPGVRELRLWGTEEELDANYDDITDIIARCKYKTCRHGSEEGCAVREALTAGTLEKSHYANYLKMKSELSKLNIKNKERIRRENTRPHQYSKHKSTEKRESLNEDNQ